MVAPKYEVDPGDRLAKAIKDASRKVEDLSEPLARISQSWFKGNASIFKVTASSGKYADYKNGGANSPYAKAKKRNYEFIYPMLMASGKLAKSLTDPDDEFAYNKVVNKNELIVGTTVTNEDNVPYPFYLHHGLGNVAAARPVVLFGTEQVAPSDMNKRVERWVLEIGNHVFRETEAFI